MLNRSNHSWSPAGRRLREIKFAGEEGDRLSQAVDRNHVQPFHDGRFQSVLARDNQTPQPTILRCPGLRLRGPL